MRAEGKEEIKTGEGGETNRAEVHQPLQTFPAVPARLPGLCRSGIAKRVGAGVRANLTVRRQERESERKGKPSTSSDPPPPPADTCAWTPAVSAEVEVSAGVMFLCCWLV